MRKFKDKAFHRKEKQNVSVEEMPGTKRMPGFAQKRINSPPHPLCHLSYDTE